MRDIGQILFAAGAYGEEIAGCDVIGAAMPWGHRWAALVRKAGCGGLVVTNDPADLRQGRRIDVLVHAFYRTRHQVPGGGGGWYRPIIGSVQKHIAIREMKGVAVAVAGEVVLRPYKLCPTCGHPVPDRRLTYCDISCRPDTNAAYEARQRERRARNRAAARAAARELYRKVIS